MRGDNNYWDKLMRRRASRRRFLGAAAGLSAGAAALALVGCGEEEEATPSPQATATTGAASTATGTAAAAAAKYGGTLPLMHGAETITLDAHTQESYASQYPVMLATNGLLWLKPQSETDPSDWVIDGDLAQSWEQLDNVTYIFKLHPGIKFHDVPPVNGRDFTADDVKYNYQRMATNDPKYRMRSQFEKIDRLEAVDNRTLKIVTKEPYAPMTFNLAYPWANMFAREVVEEGTIETKLVGTGPWVLKKWAKDVGLSYERNPNYFKKDPWTGAKLPYADKVELINMFDISTQIAAMRAGQIAALGGGKERRQDLLKTNPNLVESPEVVSISIMNVMMNTAQKPFDDIRVRQAVLWATERSEYWLAAALEGVPSGPMSTATKPWRLPAEELPKIPDLAKAKALLAEAGYAAGLEVTSSATQPYNSPQFTEVTKAQLAKIGIKVNIQMLDNATWLSKVYRGQDYQTSSYHDYLFDDPDQGLYSYYHSKGSANHTNIKDAQLDSLLEAQRVEMDYQKRRDLVLKAQRRLLELSPRVFIANSVSRTLYQPWFKGFRQISAAAAAQWRQYQFSWVDKA